MLQNMLKTVLAPWGVLGSCPAAPRGWAQPLDRSHVRFDVTIIPSLPAVRVSESVERMSRFTTGEAVQISVRIVHVCDDCAPSPARPDSRAAPVFDWRESPVTDRRYLLVAPRLARGLEPVETAASRPRPAARIAFPHPEKRRSLPSGRNHSPGLGNGSWFWQ